MSKRLSKVRKELDSRRRTIEYNVKQREKTVPMLMNRQEDSREEPDFYIPQDTNRKTPTPTRGKDLFVFRLMMAICLFLMLAILFQSTTPQAEKAKQFVQQSFEYEFEFAAISNWYENQFGRPLALVPIEQDLAQGDPNEDVEMIYALPAIGTISEPFTENGQGIMIETGMHAEIESVKSGSVKSVGQESEQGLGKTVVVEHYDGTEAIYGMLDQIEVNIYDNIRAGTIIGTVQTNEEAQKGIFYFALKNGEQYIDPSEVISFN